MKYFACGVLLVSVLFGQIRRAADELADAERAFSAASDSLGIKESFLRFLADDCVMFNPHPVNGKELYRSRPASANHLTWRPVFVEVSASGDFGVSTGPWEIRPHRQDTVVAVGYYFSVWEKNGEGEWKVILDVGLGYPKILSFPEQEYFVQLKRSSDSHRRTSAISEIASAEKKLTVSLNNTSHRVSYERIAANTLRVYRSGFPPAKGKKESLDRIGTGSSRTMFSALSTKIASSGDIGFVYGYAVSAAGDSSGYIRVWKNDNGWKLAADIEVPFQR